MEDEYELLERMGNGQALPPPPAEPGNGHAPQAEPPKSSSGRDRGDKERERGSDRDMKHRDRDRDRDRERGRSRGERERSDRDRGGERRRSSHRSRSRSPSRPHSRSHRDERDRRGDDRRGRPPPRQRAVTPPEERMAREKERELKELERASRTVFVFNLNLKADERDIYTFFSKAGEVTDIRIITDRHTKRSKGLAYIEFAKQEQVFTALGLTGQPLMGQGVMVKPAEAEKNLAWEAQQQAKQNAAEASALLGTALGLPPGAVPGMAALGGMGAVPGVAGPCTLQVSGYPDGLGDAELRQIFEPFGPVDSVEIVRDAATGAPNGTALITFSSYTDGTNAKAHWHGKPLLDGVLLVVTAPGMHRKAAELPPPPLDPAAAAAAVQAQQQAQQQVQQQNGELDEDDAGGGFKLTSQARVALMSRLAGSAGLVPPAAPALPLQPAALPPPPAVDASASMQGPLGMPSPIPTPCLMLVNMFDPAEASDPGVIEEIEDDVRSECSKFGTVEHVKVDATPGSRGFVFLRFGNVEGAQAAQRALNARFYSGKQIVAHFQFAHVYNSSFGI